MKFVKLMVFVYIRIIIRKYQFCDQNGLNIGSSYDSLIFYYFG